MFYCLGPKASLRANCFLLRNSTLIICIYDSTNIFQWTEMSEKMDVGNVGLETESNNSGDGTREK